MKKIYIFLEEFFCTERKVFKKVVAINFDRYNFLALSFIKLPTKGLYAKVYLKYIFYHLFIWPFSLNLIRVFFFQKSIFYIRKVKNKNSGVSQTVFVDLINSCCYTLLSDLSCCCCFCSCYLAFYEMCFLLLFLLLLLVCALTTMVVV